MSGIRSDAAQLQDAPEPLFRRRGGRVDDARAGWRRASARPCRGRRRGCRSAAASAGARDTRSRRRLRCGSTSDGRRELRSGAPRRSTPECRAPRRPPDRVRGRRAGRSRTTARETRGTTCSLAGGAGRRCASTPCRGRRRAFAVELRSGSRSRRRRRTRDPIRLRFTCTCAHAQSWLDGGSFGARLREDVGQRTLLDVPAVGELRVLQHDEHDPRQQAVAGGRRPASTATGGPRRRTRSPAM